MLIQEGDGTPLPVQTRARVRPGDTRILREHGRQLQGCCAENSVVRLGELTRIVTSGNLLNLDHIRTQIRKQHGSCWPSEYPRQVENLDTLQRGWDPLSGMVDVQVTDA